MFSCVDRNLVGGDTCRGRQANVREAQLKSEVASMQGQLTARSEGFQKTLDDLEKQLQKAQDLSKEREEAIAKQQSDFERRVKQMEAEVKKGVDERDNVAHERDNFAELLTNSENRFAEKVSELAEAQKKIDADAADVAARIAAAVELEKKSASYLAEAKECYNQGINHMSRCVLRAADENLVLSLQGLAEMATSDGYSQELRRYHAVVPYPTSEIQEYNEEQAKLGLPLLDNLPEVQQPNLSTLREQIEEQREREYQEARQKEDEEEAARLAAARGDTQGDGDAQA